MDSWFSLSTAYPKQWLIFKPQPTKGIRIFAEISMCVHHVSSMLAILGIWDPEGSFFLGVI